MTQPAGLAAGKIFTYSVKKYGILDNNGDGVLTASDLMINDTWVKVVGIDGSKGVITFEVAVQSATARTFDLTYRGSTTFIVREGVGYSIVTRGDSSGVALLVGPP